MILTRRHLAVLAGASLIATMARIGPAAAEEPLPAVNTLAGDRVAIHGYDPVAYFAESGPRLGRPDLSVEHEGAVWRFSSEANRDRFRADPAKYTPVFGGYCAYGAAQGRLVKIDPEAWSIVDGRLYLNYSLEVRDKWLKDIPGYNAAAKTTWQRLTASPARSSPVRTN